MYKVRITRKNVIGASLSYLFSTAIFLPYQCTIKDIPPNGRSREVRVTQHVIFRGKKIIFRSTSVSVLYFQFIIFHCLIGS